MSGEFPILYSMPDTCAVSILITLRWARADHGLRVLDHGEIQQPPFLVINPAGQVPAVVAKGQAVMTETHALLLLLADSHPDSRLAPPSSRLIERYRLEEQLAFMTGEVHPAFAPFFKPERFSEDPAQAATLKRMASRRVAPMLARLDATISDRPYLPGERTVADAFLYVLTRWARVLPGDLASLPSLARFRSRMEADPGVVAALAEHRMKPLGVARHPAAASGDPVDEHAP